MKAEKKRKKSIFLRLALLAFSIYVIVMLLQLQMELGQSQRQLDNVDQEIKNMQLLNDDLKNKMENYEAYQEQQARENGQARTGGNHLQGNSGRVTSEIS